MFAGSSSVSGRSLSPRARLVIASAGALSCWCINALALAPRLNDPLAAQAFLWNMLVLTVVVTSFHGALAVWVSARSTDPSARSGRGRVLQATARGLLAAIISFACGAAVSAATFYIRTAGDPGDLLGRAVRFMMPAGLVFALAGTLLAALSERLIAAVRRGGASLGRAKSVAVAILLWAGWLLLCWGVLAWARGLSRA